MTEPLTPADEVVLRRRGFLRSGALLAAAAGGAVAATATSALPASAASGDPVTAGQLNQATNATLLGSTDGVSATLILQPKLGGPALQLDSESDARSLGVNQLAGSELGPLVGVKYPGETQVYTDYLATASDVASVPVTFPLPPVRLLDKVSVKKGAWIEVAVDPVDDGFVPIGAHLVVTSSSSSKDGSLSVYVPGTDRGKSVTVSFLKGKTMSGSTYAALGTSSKGKQVFRVYASQNTRVSVDLTGITEIDEGIFAGASSSARRAASAAKPARVPAARLTR